MATFDPDTSYHGVNQVDDSEHPPQPDNMQLLTEEHEEKSMMPSAALSNSMSQIDPLNPQNWPLYRKIFTSLQGWMFAFTAAVGLTCFTAGTKPFIVEFGLAEEKIPEQFIAAFSLYLFGIAFAPVWVPHVTERVGRSLSYGVYITLNAIFNLGAGYGQNIATVQICRFFAGFFGGPCIVLLEGTFADMWSAETTNTYYAIQGIASFWGAAFGPFFGGYLVTASNGWRWTQWFPAILGAFALAFGLSMPETLQREIPRRQGRIQNKTRAEIIAQQTPAQSGVTLAEIIKVTIINPPIMFLTEPVVTLVTIIMFVDWMLTFQWFISVPAALGPPPPMGPGYTLIQIGKAFLGAVAGSGLGAITVILIEAITNSLLKTHKKNDPKAAFYAVEYRVLPSILGTLFITIGLFWVANTVNPNFQPIVPIIGTAFFIWGSSMVTFSIVPYTFDLFAPAGTLGAITSQAVGRILAGAFLPFLILQIITSQLTPKWGLGLFGFVTLALVPLTVLLFVFGARWREASKYSMVHPAMNGPR